MKATRHTRATELISKGVIPAKAAKQLGHDKEIFSKIYSNYLPGYDESDHSLMDFDFAKLKWNFDLDLTQNAVFGTS